MKKNQRINNKINSFSSQSNPNCYDGKPIRCKLIRILLIKTYRSGRPEVFLGKGAPKKFLVDNGEEFSNAHYPDMCEKLSITFSSAAAKRPW